MKKVISGIVISALVPFKAINLFLQFEESLANVRKLTGAQKMTDKIKVWKCEECGPESPTICSSNGENRPDTCTFNQGTHSDPSNWQQITERKPAQIDASMMGINIHEPHHQGNEGRTTAPPSDTPPRKRVKIIWSEVNAENVRIANALRDFTATIKPGDIMVGTLYGPDAVRVSDIPKSWLEDIPAEPVTEQTSEDDFSIESIRDKMLSMFESLMNREANRTEKQSFTAFASVFSVMYKYLRHEILK